MSAKDEDRVAVLTKRPNDEGQAWRVTIAWDKLAKGLAKGLVVQSYGAFVRSGIDAFGIGKAEARKPSPEEQGWLWLHRSAFAALSRTVRTHQEQLAALSDSHEEMQAFLEGVQGHDAIEIDGAFLARPAESDFGHAVVAGLDVWMKHLQVPNTSAKAIRQYLREEIAISLDLEERRGRKEGEYEDLVAFFEPTLTQQTAAAARAWRRYRATLVEQIRRPILELNLEEREAVPLEDIFVPLRGLTEFRDDDEGESGESKIAHRLVWLEDEIEEWWSLKTDSLKILSGEPGCGKSSFGKMTAACWARMGRNALFIPLDSLKRGLDAFDSIRDFAARPEVLSREIDPLDEATVESPLLLILDGLDELSEVAKNEGERATLFVQDVALQLHKANTNGRRIAVLLTGRPIVTERSTKLFDQAERTLRVCRLHFDSEPLNLPDTTSKELLADMRDLWWQRFARASALDFSGVPTQLAKGPRQVQEITAQPLLNYILALVVVAEDVDFQVRSVNELYRTLFDILYRRKQAPSGLSKESPTDRLTRSQYERMLQEIALAAWHTGQGSVPGELLEERMNAHETTRRLLKEHYGDIRSGVFAIVNTFFLKPDSIDSKGVYQFSHKSFYEYLTVRRLVGELRAVSRLLANSRSPDVEEPFTIKRALARWLRLCGPTPLTMDLFRLLRTELILSATSERAERQTEPLGQWLETATRLMNHALRLGFDLPAGRSIELHDQSRNAEVALLALLSAVLAAYNAERSGRSFVWAANEPLSKGGNRPVRLRLHWRDVASNVKSIDSGWYAAGDFLHRILRQDRISTASSVSLTALANLDLSDACLYCQDLEGADLSNSGLRTARLFRAYLERADLRGADLKEADLREVGFEGADLEEADLTGADLGGATLRGANLSGACLVGADLTEANLSHADLIQATLTSAHIEGADLAGANLRGANLTEAVLEGATLKGADLTLVRSERPYLAGADLREADLRGAKLKEAVLRGADLRNANLEAADLRGADLREVDFEGADLRDTNFSGAIRFDHDIE